MLTIHSRGTAIVPMSVPLTQALDRMTQEFAVPTKDSRTKALLFYVALGAFWISNTFFVQPLFKQKLAQPLCDALPWTRAVVIYWAALFLLLSAGLIRASILTLRSGQSPFPGAFHLFRTPISRGWRASVNGYVLAAIAFSIIASLAWAWHFFQLGYVFCIYDSCSC